uniref:Uncharacterized protein n=1 Tax=viral metagenome TaxID=1070528 RepID=A0A6M3LMM9_9ZZZZ
MPLVLGIGGLLIAGLFGVATILDKVDDIGDQGKSAVSLGSIIMIGIGGLTIYYLVKKK